jgi:hypothetical protein
MILEKDKVYKIDHFSQRVAREYDRTYIICSPTEDVDTYKGSFETHFTICFSGRIITHGLKEGDDDFTRPSGSSISREDTIEEITDHDYKEIREAIGMLGGRYRYNRRLNKLIPTYVKEGTSI